MPGVSSRSTVRQGFTTAIDDFGVGFSGLSLLAEFQPDVIKVDMGLVRGIDASPPRRAIMAGVVATARALGVAVVAEGIETPAEAATLASLGISLMQGYLIARPMTAGLPPVSLPDVLGADLLTADLLGADVTGTDAGARRVA
jgi:EAL domain-containing protein (putative c-di-GMP-specific phosphodiesterase class I)